MLLMGWLLVLVLLALTVAGLKWHDRKRADARIQCERQSPPWKTAECAALK